MESRRRRRMSTRRSRRHIGGGGGKEEEEEEKKEEHNSVHLSICAYPVLFTGARGGLESNLPMAGCHGLSRGG